MEIKVAEKFLYQDRRRPALLFLGGGPSDNGRNIDLLLLNQ